MAEKLTIAELGKLSRHWFQFRLRTLLVGVVLLSIPCAYVAHEAGTVAARRAWASQHPAMVHLARKPSNQPGDPPLIRRWLGDMNYYVVEVHSNAEVGEGKSLFPEASLIMWDRH